MIKRTSLLISVMSYPMVYLILLFIVDITNDEDARQGFGYIAATLALPTRLLFDKLVVWDTISYFSSDYHYLFRNGIIGSIQYGLIFLTVYIVMKIINDIQKKSNQIQE